MRTIAVIDSNSLMHRAFHAVQTPMTAPDGRPTNACFGFMSMLLKMIETFKPAAIICAFDQGIPDFRMEAIQAYKAQRPPTDPDLKVQFPMVEELLKSMNIPVIKVQGWEGDDILGTLAAKAEAAGNIQTLLVTGDKDALQLATNSTHIVNTKTGMSDVVVYDPAAVEERFGVAPKYVPDYLGLMGDASDNIPGVPGVGAKTATKLLQEYGNMDGVFDHAAEIKGKLGEKIAANIQQGLDSRRVATIIRDVPVDIDLDAVSFPDFDVQTVQAAFGELQLNNPLRRILALKDKLQDGDGRDKGTVPMSTSTSTFSKEVDRGTVPLSRLKLRLPEIISGPAAEAELSKLIQTPTTVAVYLVNEQTPKNKENPQQSMLMDEFSSQHLYIANGTSILKFTIRQIVKVLSLLVESSEAVSLVAFDTKSLLQKLLPADLTQPAMVKEQDILVSQFFDLSLADYLLDSAKAATSPEQLAKKYLTELDLELPEDSDLDAGQAELCLRLHKELSQALTQDGSIDCFMNIEMPLVPVLLQMERQGVNVDPEVLGQLSVGMTKTIEDLRSQAYLHAEEEFNLDSPKQVGEILFDKLMLPPTKKTHRGYSTDASVLADLKPKHPLPGIILEYRELAKLKSTYLDALPLLIANDQHIHTSFNQTVAATGRLSSSDPNLQNIPVRSELGRQIRTAFVPDAKALGVMEATFLSADYSQIELRLLAHLSSDEHLIAAFISGEDFHAQTAARVFDVPVEEVTPELRSRAKAVNFGIVYGQQAYGLSSSLGIGFAEAQEMIKLYFAAYPQVRSYLDSLKAQAYDQGWVETMFGRKRHIPEINSSNGNQRQFGERMAMNHPMQGSAADIIKLAMIEVQRRLVADGFRSQMILQVHDELDFNCDIAELDSLSKMVSEAMSGVVELKVPLLVDITSGKNWAVAH